MQTIETESGPPLVAAKTVPKLARFQKLVSSRNVAKIRREIEAKWGFVPSEAYCKELLIFVDEMTAPQQE